MRVLALTKYGTHAASTRQRFLQYRPYFEERGATIDLAPLIDNNQFGRISKGGSLGISTAAHCYVRRLMSLLRSGSYDVLWIHYELFPYAPGFLERLAFLGGRPVVLDYDDAIFHIYDQHPRRLGRALLGRKLQPLLRRAKAVMCGNAYLRDYAARFSDNCLVVPTVVDTNVYLPPAAPRPADQPLVIGWIGSPSTWRDVEPFIPAIRAAADKYGATFRAIGAGPRAEGRADVDALDWDEGREVADVQGMDIGIMPVADHPFQRGKCGYKLIQYMACARPVVASPVGVNVDLATPETGFVARTPDEWTDALLRLLEDANVRLRMGAAGRRLVERRYSLASQQARVFATLADAAQ